jgi:arginine repressor
VTSEARRRAVARIVTGRRIATQGALLAALRREGFRATQATLSRDLALLGAHRVSRSDGAWYQVDGGAAAQRSAAVRDLVLGIEANSSLAVIRTAVGAASAVARAIDDARLGARDHRRRRHHLRGAGCGGDAAEAGGEARRGAGRVARSGAGDRAGLRLHGAGAGTARRGWVP